MAQLTSQESLEIQLAALESSAANFAFRFIPDAAVRVEYNKRAKALSKEILEEVKSGKISTLEGKNPWTATPRRV